MANQDETVRLHNVSKRPFQIDSLTLQPGQVGTFSAEQANKLRAAYPHELKSAEDMTVDFTQAPQATPTPEGFDSPQAQRPSASGVSSQNTDEEGDTMDETPAANTAARGRPYRPGKQS